MTIRNATITGTKLGVHHTDHGILSFYIMLDYGGESQGFGGWVLDTVNKLGTANPTRVPTTLGSGLLLGIHRLFGCDWEDLKGQSCRADATHTKVVTIGHYLEDKWLWLKSNGADMEFVVTSFETMEKEQANGN